MEEVRSVSQLTCVPQGTGTKAGDPVETSAIHRTIGQGATQSRKLWIGSVKPNVSHPMATMFLGEPYLGTWKYSVDALL